MLLNPALGFPKKFFLWVLVLLVLGMVVLAGYFFLRRSYPPDEKRAILTQIETIIHLIQNPNPGLVAKYKITPEAIEAEKNIIIHGGDPQSIRIRGMSNPPDSLLGIRQVLEQNNFDQASKRTVLENLKKLYTRVANPLLSRDGKTTDETLWTKEEVEQIDPRRIFILPPRVTGGSSAIKEEAAKGVIRLGYQLVK